MRADGAGLGVSDASIPQIRVKALSSPALGGCKRQAPTQAMLKIVGRSAQRVTVEAAGTRLLRSWRVGGLGKHRHTQRWISLVFDAMSCELTSFNSSGLIVGICMCLSGPQA
jgi:hypothetical protein